jgi:hypothetical protein
MGVVPRNKLPLREHICISQVQVELVRSFGKISIKCDTVKYDVGIITPLAVHMSLTLTHRFIYCRHVLRSCSCACRTVFTHDKDVGEVVYCARRNLFTPVSSFAASFIIVLTFRQALSVHASAFNSNLSTFPSLLPVSSKPSLYKTSLQCVTCSARSLRMKCVPLHVRNFTDLAGFLCIQTAQAFDTFFIKAKIFLKSILILNLC